MSQATKTLSVAAFLYFLFYNNSIIFCEKILDENNCISNQETRFIPAWTKTYERRYNLLDIGSDLLKSLAVINHNGDLTSDNRYVASSLFNCLGK